MDKIYKFYLSSGKFVRFRAISRPVYKKIVYEQVVWDIDRKMKYKLYIPIKIGNYYYSLFSKMFKKDIESNYIFTILAFDNYGKVSYIVDELKKEDLINKYFLFCDQVMRSRIEDIIDNEYLGTDLGYMYKKLLYYYTKDELKVFLPEFVEDALDTNRI